MNEGRPSYGSQKTGNEVVKEEVHWQEGGSVGLGGGQFGVSGGG